MSFDWYHRDSGAWLKIESQLTLEQAGALNVLADTIHKLNAPLVDDNRRIAGVLGCHTNKWRAIKRRLIEIGAIKIDGERLDIPAIVGERKHRDSIETRARLAGEKSAEMRKTKGLVSTEERRGEKEKEKGKSDGFALPPDGGSPSQNEGHQEEKVKAMHDAMIGKLKNQRPPSAPRRWKMGDPDPEPTDEEAAELKKLVH